MTQHALLAGLGLAAMIVATPAEAGPDWEESLGGGDAGKLPETAQRPSGLPAGAPLDTVSGELAGTLLAAGTGDFVDMFIVFIEDPLAFSASTATADGGFSGFDSQLWLFDVGGTGLLGNDGLTAGATLLRNSNDGTNIAIDQQGIYLLAISTFDHDPINGDNLPLFSQLLPGEVSGPDGPGGGDRVADWAGPALGAGEYTITLTGCVFPPQCVEDCAPRNDIVDVADLLQLLAEWGTPAPNQCDFAPGPIGDGVVDINDLLALLAAWGPCGPPTS